MELREITLDDFLFDETTMTENVYRAFWCKIRSVTERNYRVVFTEMAEYIRLHDVRYCLNQLVAVGPTCVQLSQQRATLDTPAAHYKGTWLHHLILDQFVTQETLPYAMTIVAMAGGDFYGAHDSCGRSPNLLLNLYRCGPTRTFSIMTEAATAIAACNTSK